MVRDAVGTWNLGEIDYLFIENVGNLVCPASFDLGQHRSVALLSYTEGDDKPAKYPVLFRGADLVLLTKSDLAPHMEDFEPARAERCVRELASAAPVHSLSARKGTNLRPWLDWVRAGLASVREAHSHDHRERVAG